MPFDIDFFEKNAKKTLMSTNKVPFWSQSYKTTSGIYAVLSEWKYGPSEELCVDGTEVYSVLNFVPTVRMDGVYRVNFRPDRVQVVQETADNMSFVSNPTRWLKIIGAKSVFKKGEFCFVTVTNHYIYRKQFTGQLILQDNFEITTTPL